jgi:hypothetical protein
MDLFAGVGGLVSGIIFIVFAIISILAPIWLYLINVYTHETRDELKKTNKLLESLVQITESQSQSVNPSTLQPVVADSPFITKLEGDPTRPEVSKAKCGKCGYTITYQSKHAGRSTKCKECDNHVMLP